MERVENIYFYAPASAICCFNGTLFSNWKSFTEEFTPRLTLGFGADLSMVHKGLTVNYGLATDGHRGRCRPAGGFFIYILMSRKTNIKDYACTGIIK